MLEFVPKGRRVGRAFQNPTEVPTGPIYAPVAANTTLISTNANKSIYSNKEFWFKAVIGDCTTGS